MTVTKAVVAWIIFCCFAHCNAKDKVLTREQPRPNIVFILTDDQDVQLGGLTPMVKLKKLMKDEGTEFTNMFVTTPLCCPSRTSILTGRYQHNHATLNNSISGNCSSRDWQQTLEKETIGTFAKSLKYETFYAGKYLNQYGSDSVGGPEHIPPGWDHWLGLVKNSKYYNYTVSDNGVPVKHGDDYHKDYFTDLIANRSVQYIKDRSRFFDDRPFLMMISTPAPHSPWNAAPQYESRFPNDTAPKTGNYNTRGKDQHWLLRQPPIPMKAVDVAYSNNAFRSRWRTLLSIDDLVEKVIGALYATGVLDDTFVIYSSDNGYHLGQFGLPIDKRQLYEFDLRVPLIVRGPGVPKNVTRTEPVLNIDLAPTMLDIANGSTGNFPETMDGRSFRTLLKTKADPTNDEWRTDFLVEYQGEGAIIPPHCPKLGYGVTGCFPSCICEDAFNNTYSCVRTLNSDSKYKNIMYCEFTDSETFVEVYNLTSDPNQLTNIRGTVDPQLLVKMNTRLIELGDCSSSSCRNNAKYSSRPFGPEPELSENNQQTFQDWGRKIDRPIKKSRRLDAEIL